MSPLVIAFGDRAPDLSRAAFVAPNATLIGDVVLGEDASVWFGAVLRGDCGSIRIGARTNLQDMVMGHMTGGLSNLAVGDDVTVGHGAILHGCTIGHRVLVGMGAILLDNVEVGDDSVIAAGALVPPRLVIPPRSLVKGNPAQVVREVKPHEQRLGIDGAEHYGAFARVYASQLGTRGG